MAGLITHELLIDESDTSTLEVDQVALVDEPAIESNWFAFGKVADIMQFATVDKTEHIIVGPAMIPDKLIFRRDPDGEEYNVFFSKDTVKAIALKYFKKNFQNNTNIMHDPLQKKDGVTFFLSFFRDTAKGMVGLEGNYPDGTWFLGAKVSNPEVWQKIESGEIKGFSVQGMFKYKKAADTPEQLFEKIKAVLSGISS